MPRIPEAPAGNKARLQAALLARGNTSLVSESGSTSNKGPLKCFYCSGALDYRFNGTLCEWLHVVVTHVPMFTCLNCGDQSYDLTVLDALERAIAKMTGTVDFRHLVQ